MLLNWVRYAAFPASLAGLTCAASVATARGLSGPVIVATLAGLALALAWLAERLVPYIGAPPQRAERRADWSFFVLTAVVDSVVVSWFEPTPVRDSLLEVNGALAIPLGLVGWELGAYVAHRLGHELPMLWRFHALHHAPQRMVALNNYRLHPVDLMLKDVFAMGVLIAIGIDAQALIAIAVLKNTVVSFQHCDADLRHGWLNYVFSTNTVHRWHHSSLPEEGNANYGTVLLVWDALFGSLRLPRDRAAPQRLGLYHGQGYPTHRVFRSLLAPWCWTRCTASAEGADPEPTEAAR